MTPYGVLTQEQVLALSVATCFSYSKIPSGVVVASRASRVAGGSPHRVHEVERLAVGGGQEATHGQHHLLGPLPPGHLPGSSSIAGAAS